MTTEEFLDRINPEPMTGCWLWEGWTDSDGYGQLRRPGGIRSAHRFSYRLHNGDIPEGACVLHRCDVPLCVNPAHLYVGTHSQNMQDAYDRGQKSAVGEKNGRARLSADDVRSIRGSLADGEVQRVLAERFGVAVSTIAAIATGRTWSHLDE